VIAAKAEDLRIQEAATRNRDSVSRPTIDDYFAFNLAMRNACMLAN
jgi:hypothetical protein